MPFTAAASTSLPTPWYLDYGHLAFWFFLGATLVLVLWVAYLSVSLTRHIEDRRPVRETRGLSRAQTGDMLTAVLPLTWSITMLGHASTHSINFDENTTATVLSVSILAYQWGWNYFFPRDVIALIHAQPLSLGRGRVSALGLGSSSGVTQLSYRQAFWARSGADGAYTAKHGRHTPAAAPALTLALGGGAAHLYPDWAKVSLVPTTVGAVPGTEVGLQLAGVGRATLHVPSLLVRWRQQCQARVWGAVSASQAPAALVVTDRLPALAFGAQGWWLYGGLAADAASAPLTQNQHSGAQLSWRGNRLAGVYAHLTASGVSSVGLGRSSHVSALIQRHGQLSNQSCGVAFWVQPQNLGLGGGGMTQLGVTQLGTAHTQTLNWGLGSEVGSQPSRSLSAGFLGFSVGQGRVMPGQTKGSIVAGRWLPSGAEVALAGGEVGRLFSPESYTHQAAGRGERQQLVPLLLSAHQKPVWGVGALISSAASLQLWGRQSGLGLGAVLEPATPSVSAARLCRWGVGMGASTGRGVLLAVELLRPSVGQGGLRRWALGGVEGAPTTERGTQARPRLRTGLDAPTTAGVSSGVVVELTPAAMPQQQWLAVRVMRPLCLATSDSIASRASASIPRDWSQLNGRGGAPLVLEREGGCEGAGRGLLAQRAALWASSVSQAGLPWDHLVRATVARKPGAGVGNTWAEVRAAQAPAILSLQRGRVDKALSHSIWPLAGRGVLGWIAPTPVPAILDVERFTSVSGTPGLLLPAAHLDVDLVFVLTRWAAEVNTSRRSDHAAKYAVVWGPLAAGVSSVGGVDAEPQPTLPMQSGAGLAANLNGPRRQQLFWLLTGGVLGVLHAPRVATLSLQSRVVGGGIQPTWVEAVLGGSQSPRMLSASLSQLAHVGALVQAGGGALGVATIGRVSQRQHSQWYVSSAVELAVRAPRYRLNPASERLASLEAGRLEPLQVAHRGGYAPLDARMSAMRRLRVTKGVYLPADTPMHGIFGSKDVIHSWAIPGLGIKVDCIPGYSSHRRLNLRWRGFYWGQCMEVCGRYHHWMPILVRVVHRDLFLTWCLAYVRLLSGTTTQGPAALRVQQLGSLWGRVGQAR